ncbi:MAG: hypothetical protein ACK4ND_07890 [Cytophagaceae bacterium]
MKSFYTILSILLIFSCSKTKDPIGPELMTPSSEFRIQEDFLPGINSIDFNSRSQYFVAYFNERVSWTITLIGEESGAKKVIKGVSKEINEANSNWDGAQDGIIFFRNESVKAVLSFYGNTKTTECEFRISRTKTYEGASLLGNGFENTFREDSPLWGYSPYPSASYGSVVEFPVVQGNFAYMLSGKDTDNDYWICQLRRRYTQNQLPENPQDVWINVYVYGNGNNNSILKISGKEDDFGNNNYNDARDDSWEHEVNLSHTGWKLVSVKYSNFIRSTVINYGGNGNKKQEPHKIRYIDFTLLASNPGGSGQVVIDFPIITVEKPFKP